MKTIFFTFVFFYNSTAFCQNGSNSRIPCCEYKEVVDDFSSKKPNFHFYSVENVICKVDEFKNVSREKVFSILLSRNSYVAPISDSNAVVNCQQIDIPAVIAGVFGLSDYFQDDPIITVIDNYKYSVTNFTLNTHTFHAGKVVREIIQRGPNIIIRTRGTGNNKNEILAWVNKNKIAVDVIWNNLDKKFITDARKALASNSYPALNNEENLSKGAKLLFANAKCKLSDYEKNNIYEQLEFQLTSDEKHFTIFNDDKYTFPFKVLPTDLNQDGQEEIFVGFGNSFTSGMTGQDIVLFIKDENCLYKKNLGFPGLLPDALLTKNMGYNDLFIGGPGYNFPIWRWNGKEYIFYKTVKGNQIPSNRIDIEVISNNYEKSLTN